jgi:16S rRNA (uracil1498-N3)-methyltransferase
MARLYVDTPLGGEVLEIADRDAHYLGHVLRLRRGDSLIVFNGAGEERVATVERLTRNDALIRLRETVEPQPPSRLELTLLQGLVKADAMDAVIQKATELGVTSIVAAATEYGVVKHKPDRERNRLRHWSRIAASACEQSGRHRPPDISLASSLADAVTMLPMRGLRLALHNAAPKKLRDLGNDEATVSLAIGPEGGFGDRDLAVLERASFKLVGLGPRILRTDTAAIAACTIAQLKWGDFS